MTYFAAVAAVRIQSWLARTPDLRYVRGASLALTDETSPTTLEQAAVLPHAVMIDPDTSPIAGVVVLRSDDLARLDQAVDLLLDHLQARLPGVEWTAWRSEAPSYVQAYDAMKNGAEGVQHWRRLPVSLSLPIAASCSRCAHELATTSVYKPDGTGKEGVGPDCAARRQRTIESGFKDFEELAQVGTQGFTLGRRDAGNHLATVCADGNRVGAFFTAVAALNDPALQASLSNALDSAMRRAAEEAKVQDGREVAMNHFVGGDDLFASVAAPFAWPYVETLSRVFNEAFQQAVAQAFEEHPSDEVTTQVKDAAQKVSLGIGVAFAHAKHPIADTRESAVAAEARAKAGPRGAEGAASWLDITVERSTGQGLDEIPGARWVRTAQLTQDLNAEPKAQHPALVMNPSARAVLVSLLRPQEGEDAEGVAEAVRVWATRVDRPQLLTYLPEPGSAQADAMLEHLRQTADRGRWWPWRQADPADDITQEEA